MKHVIILRGPLGVGKSTIARELAEKLNGEHIPIDRVLEELKLDKVDGECIPAANFKVANEHVLPRIQQRVRKGYFVVIDGSFYHEEQINHLMEHLPDECQVFTLQASIDVCIARDRSRERQYGEDAARAVHRLVSRFDYGQIIHTEHKSVEEVAHEIMECLADRDAI